MHRSVHRLDLGRTQARTQSRRWIGNYDSWPAPGDRRALQSRSENLPWPSTKKSRRFDIWDYDEMIADSCG
jgi:hypothetical protein